MARTKLPEADRKAIPQNPDARRAHRINILERDAKFFKAQIIPSLIFGIVMLMVTLLVFLGSWRINIYLIMGTVAGFSNFFVMKKKSRDTLEKAIRFKVQHEQIIEDRNLF